MTTTTATVTDHELRTIAYRALSTIGDQVVLSQGRCVDVLLDLLQSTTDEVIQATIMERLSDIRWMSTVEAAEMRAGLEAILEMSWEDGQPGDLAWAELAPGGESTPRPPLDATS